jgi:phage shock protein C
MGTRLYRSREDRMLAGVAGGLADYTGIDPSLVRVVWALLFFAGGVGLLLYIVMAIVVPEEPEFDPTGSSWAAPTAAGATPPPAGSAPAPGTPPAAGNTVDGRAQREADREARRAARRARGGDGRTASIIVGGILVLIGVGFLLREFIPSIDFDLFWPLVLVVLGIVVLATALRPRGPSGTAGSGDRS